MNLNGVNVGNERITKEMLEFFEKVQTGTGYGVIEWELTANKNILIATLGDEFIARLEKIEASDGTQYVLSLMRSRDVVFRLSPGDFLNSALVGEQGPEHPSRAFQFLWEAAARRTRNITKDVIEVNRLLDERLSVTKPELFSKIVASSR